VKVDNNQTTQLAPATDFLRVCEETPIHQLKSQITPEDVDGDINPSTSLISTVAAF
jgi:hypothetical protein